MRKILVSLLMIFTILSSMCVFATEEIVDGSQVIELDSYEDYEALLGDQMQLTDEEYEATYKEQMEYMVKYYDEYEVEDFPKAKVLEVYEPETMYETDYSGFVYKLTTQDVKVRLLEGEYEGEEVTVTYPLVADMLGNLKMKELKKGDVIYVAPAMDEETNELYADVAGVGFNVERKTPMIILAIVTAALIAIYGKEKGILSLLLSGLILVVALLICTEQIYLGTQIIVLTLLLSAVIASMITITKLGLTKDAVLASVSSVVVLAVIALVTFGVDALVKNTGGTFEAMLLVENIIKQNIDFHHLFVGSIILILSAIVPFVACDVWKSCKEAGEGGINKLLDASKSAMFGKLEIVTSILMVLLMPKLMYLYSYKYTTNEIMNSDFVVTEFIRLFMCLIGIVLTVPTTVFMYHFFNKSKNANNNK